MHYSLGMQQQLSTKICSRLGTWATGAGISDHQRRQRSPARSGQHPGAAAVPALQYDHVPVAGSVDQLQLAAGQAGAPDEPWAQPAGARTPTPSSCSSTRPLRWAATQGYEYALSPYDIPHNVAMSGTYQLPFGHGRAYLNKATGSWTAFLADGSSRRSSLFAAAHRIRRLSRGDRANTGVGGQRPNLNPAGCNPNFQRDGVRMVRQDLLRGSAGIHLRPGAREYAAL